MLVSVGHQDRHVTATFSATGADDVTVYISTSPTVASDGKFLSENIMDVGFLTDSEIQSGFWLNESQTDPGSYWVMLSASRDFFACSLPDYSGFDLACADGLSSMLALTIPTPTTKYKVKSDLLRNINILYLTLVGDPLGTKVPYQVCWKQPAGKRKASRKQCRNGSLDGYSWNDDASDLLRISTRGLPKRTKFTWRTRGAGPEVLLTKTIRTS